MTQWRWGLIGTGSICDQFARDLRFVEGAELAAVASREPAKAAAFAATHAIPRSLGDFAAMLADPGIDIVYIGSPHSEHLDHAASALRAGKHVLCEKPLTMSRSQADQLAATWRTSGRYLMEAMWTWFLPAIRQVQLWIAEGRIGALKHIKADFGYPQRYDPAGRMYNPALGGGALLDMGVYPIALAWLLHRQMPRSIEVCSKAAANGVIDDLTMMFDYGEHVATLGTSFRCKLQNWAYVIGRDGYIAIPDFWRAREAMLYRLDTCVEHYRDDRLHQGFAYEAAAVQADIGAGRIQSGVVSIADSLAIQTLMDQVRARC